MSLVMAAAVAVAYSWGSAGVIGWEELDSVPAVFYSTLQWVPSSLIRVMLLHDTAASTQIAMPRLSTVRSWLRLFDQDGSAEGIKSLQCRGKNT